MQRRPRTDNAAPFFFLWCFYNCYHHCVEAWSLRSWVTRTSRPVRTMFKIATITTAISIGPMNASADIKSASKQNAFIKDPFRIVQQQSLLEPEDSLAVSATYNKKPSPTAVLVTGAGALIAYGITAKTSSIDKLTSKKRRREFSEYLTTNRQKPMHHAETMSQRSRSATATSGLRTMTINGGDSTATILSSNKDVLRTTGLRVLDKPTVLSSQTATPSSKQQRILTTAQPTSAKTGIDDSSNSQRLANNYQKPNHLPSRLGGTDILNRTYSLPSMLQSNRLRNERFKFCWI